MVRMTANGYVIEVNTNSHPANEYTETINDIIDALGSIDREVNTGNNYNALLMLLKEMMPTFDQAKLMLDNTCN